MVKLKYSEAYLFSDFSWALSDLLDVYAEATGMTHFEMLAKLGYSNINVAVAELFKVYLKILSPEECTPGVITRILHSFFREGVRVYRTSPRRLLQITGTEFFRDNISQSFWTDVAPKRNVIFTDVRFDNELDFVHANGGKILKIVNKNQQVITSSSHASEQLVYTATPDYTIEHDGVTLASIERAVDEFIATL
ncbi:hypothetical protein D3C80_1470500 [compost metagenome]